ncbi:YitT family protein [Neobacillus soli]|uniref:YitT family protein n=1 Tax=Neobacillus soli TaxID=220688 RepID=UPI000826D93E|nr:YitT family protein [Neobacillus soli]
MKDVMKIIFGNSLIGSSYACLVVPHEIINGGVTSLALILNAISGAGITKLANIITFLLLLICLIFLGRDYFFKSILSSICYLFFFNFFYSLQFSTNLNQVSSIILASVLIALGYYFCISANATTVGVDVIAIILHHRNKKIDIAIAIRCLNYIVLLFGFSLFGWISIIKGVIFTFIYSLLLKKLLNRNQVVILDKDRVVKN